MLKLHIVQASSGDCFILEYGTSAPRFILIDGGLTGTYSGHLKPVLEDLRANHRDLQALVLTHVDADHVNGLLKLTDGVKREKKGKKLLTVNLRGKTLWFNSFGAAINIGSRDLVKHTVSRALREVSDAKPFEEMVAKGIEEGNQLRDDAWILEMSLNPGFASQLVTVDEAPRPLATLDNLSLTVVGPTQENVDKLREEWVQWLEGAGKLAIATGRSIAAAARELDDSVTNLSSIMLYAEADGKTMLLTGDGRSDHLVAGLKQAGLLRDGKQLHVDLLKLPHHGSIRNITTPGFFHTVIADTYVISANGLHGNPDKTTLEWLIQAVQEQHRQVEIVITSRPKQIDWMMDKFPPMESGYRLRGPIQNGQHEIVWPFS